jgi:hypothetical protein
MTLEFILSTALFHLPPCIPETVSTNINFAFAPPPLSPTHVPSPSTTSGQNLFCPLLFSNFVEEITLKIARKAFSFC